MRKNRGEMMISFVNGFTQSRKVPESLSDLADP